MISQQELDTLFEIGLKLAKEGHMQGVRIIEEATTIKNNGLVGKSYKSRLTEKAVALLGPDNTDDFDEESEFEEEPVVEKKKRGPKPGSRKTGAAVQRQKKIMSVFKNAENAPTATLQEVAELAGFPDKTVYADLRKLKDQGKVIVLEGKGEGAGRRPPNLWAPANYKE